MWFEIIKVFSHFLEEGPQVVLDYPQTHYVPAGSLERYLTVSGMAGATTPN